jgi:hypothetical protein
MLKNKTSMTMRTIAISMSSGTGARTTRMRITRKVYMRIMISWSVITMIAKEAAAGPNAAI